jgi:hypothetical protein
VAAISIKFSVLLRLNMLYQPNSLDVLCWTAFYYFVYKYIQEAKSRYIWLAAVIIALGLLNKYNIIFLLLGFLPALLLSRYRQVLYKKQLWLAALFSFLLIAPNLWWQIQNDLPVMNHLSTLAKEQLAHVSSIDFLKDQLLFFIGSLTVLIAGYISFFKYPPFKNFKLFFWAYCLTILIFLFFKAKGYYAVGLYPMLLAFGAVYIEKLLAAGWKKYLRPAVIAFNLAAFIPFIRVAFPVLRPEMVHRHIKKFEAFDLLRWEDGKDHALPQDFADMLGWKELSLKVDSAYEVLDDPAHTLVLCSNYGEAGAINYYSRHKKIEAVSFNADYINWFPLEKELKHVILVTQKNEATHWEKIAGNFSTVRSIGEITDPYARENGTKIFLLQNSSQPLNGYLKIRIQAGKENPF